MVKQKASVSLISRLQYLKGDLIIKEGDYGISFYEIVSGNVGVYKHSGDEDVLINMLGPGEIFGEMTFLQGSLNPQFASVRALEDSIIEVRHFSIIAKEYKKMPTILKYIINQSLKRLLRITGIVTNLETANEQKREIKDNKLWSSKRYYYRKEVDIKCLYSPVEYKGSVRLWGQIKNISRSGLGLEISDENTFSRSHNPGDEFILSTVLPTDKKLEIIIKIVTAKKGENKKVDLGVIFVDLSEDAIKTLGFFLMP